VRWEYKKKMKREAEANLEELKRYNLISKEWLKIMAIKRIYAN
jgi:hypothetical protein